MPQRSAQPRTTANPARAILASAAAAALILAAGAPASLAQQDTPPGRDALGRRPTEGQTTTLAFRDVTVEKVIPFIVESTGKIVLPQRDVLNLRITIINDEPIPQSLALDYVFLALQQAGVAVVERADIILLRNIEEIDRQDVLVIGPDESVLDRQDVGNIAEKVFSLRYNNAKNMETVLEDALPSYARLAIDEQSNAIVVRGNIALLQRMERLVNSLDRPSETSLGTQTFRLRFADAEQVAENIRELFEDDDAQGAQSEQQQRMNFFRGRPQQEEDQSSATPSANLRVTANAQQNSVTVVAEESIVQQIAQLVDEVWDQPLREEAVVPRIYDLEHSDPIKVRDLLLGLFGQPGTTQGGASSGVGRLAGQFTFQALPEAGRLVVIAKSPDNLFVIDEIIRGLDQPQDVGLPEIVELKHANAEELAEQLNALLATEGTIAEIRRAESGLSEGGTSVSPFSQDPADTGDDAADTPDLLQFWWQSARVPTENRGASNLVGRIRIVPVWRQNAVMILSPPEYRQSVVDLLEKLDQPGRQVLISAVIAEISLADATSLGLRWSSSNISPENPDNAFSIGFDAEGTQDDFVGSLFNTSVLNANVDLNVILQALAQKTAVNILSEPRIFTADNQEAEFFDGQDIPFITDSQTTDQGSLIQSTDYRAVGIQLRVRPRITVNRDVDLRVNLELSSIAPGVSINNQFIVDRRETTTQLIIRDQQTVVISGILRSEESDVRRKVPLLGDIPLIGLLFQSMDREVATSELVAFITPIVVDNPTEMDTVNAPYRQRLNTLRDTLDDDLEELRKQSGGVPEPITPEPPPGTDANNPAPPQG
ncbi:MAG: secretin N-terminal domain-containing protein [Phycisphaerales bacterium]